MPANLGTPADARLRRGAYITDGHELWFVLGTRSERPRGEAPRTVLDVEDCANGELMTLDPERVRGACRLVDPAVE